MGGYVVDQKKPVAPWSNSPNWGRFTDAASLPNCVGSSFQIPDVDYGDIAFADAEDSLYRCVVPTIGGAVWSAIPSGSGVLSSGTYVPTFTPVINVDAVTLIGARYMRIGSIVSVQVEAVLDPTSSGTAQFRCSLPVASVIAADGDLSGLAIAVPGTAGTVEADSVNHRALIQVFVTSGTPLDVHFQFMYSLVP